MTRHHRPLPARLLAGLSAVALALALVLGLVPGLGGAPAGAHDGPAAIVVEATHPAGLQVHYIVRVTWADDGHPADGATVTATAVGADGTQVTPVTLTQSDSDGRYAGALEYPSAGSWTLRVTSIEPTGTVEQAEEVTALPSTTAPTNEVTTSPGDGGEAGDDAGGEGGFAPADDGTGESGQDEDAAAEPAGDGGGGDGGIPVYLIVAAAAVVVIGAVTAVNMIRRGGCGAPGGPAEPATEPSGNGAPASVGDGQDDAAAGATASRGGAGSQGDVAPSPGP